MLGVLHEGRLTSLMIDHAAVVGVLQQLLGTDWTREHPRIALFNSKCQPSVPTRTLSEPSGARRGGLLHEKLACFRLRRP